MAMWRHKPMAPHRTRTVALLLTGVLATAVPSFAQQRGRETRREAAARVPPRAGGESRGAQSQPQGSTRQRGESQPRTEARQPAQPQPQVEQGQRAQPQQRAEQGQRAQAQQRVETRQRSEGSRSVESRGTASSRGNDNRTSDNRRNDTWRNDDRRNDDRRSDNRRYDDRRYDNRSPGTRTYRSRTYVIPYGYRPYGYRPGWSLNLYFGRPYGSYAYPSAGYGYYALRPGLAYGAVRIVDAPRDAQVFVDGYYAGVVDDYDGVFQHLNLEAGPHTIEIEFPGYPSMAFDVNVLPGQTITYHANLY